MQAVSEAAALPPDLRALIEHVMERLGMGSGSWRGEFEFQDGRLTVLRRHEKIHARDVDLRFQIPHPED